MYDFNLVAVVYYTVGVVRGFDKDAVDFDDDAGVYEVALAKQGRHGKALLPLCLCVV